MEYNLNVYVDIQLIILESQPFLILEPNGCELAVNGCDFNIYKPPFDTSLASLLHKSE